MSNLRKFTKTPIRPRPPLPKIMISALAFIMISSLTIAQDAYKASISLSAFKGKEPAEVKAYAVCSTCPVRYYYGYEITQSDGSKKIVYPAIDYINQKYAEANKDVLNFTPVDQWSDQKRERVAEFIQQSSDEWCLDHPKECAEDKGKVYKNWEEFRNNNAAALPNWEEYQRQKARYYDENNRLKQTRDGRKVKGGS